MRITDVVLILAVLQSCVVQAAVLKHHSSTSKKINIDSSYAPTSTACPTGPLVRTSTAINPDESEYIQKHQKSNQLAWVNWLSSSKGPNLDAEGGFQGDLASYLSDVNNLPKVAIAMSGGGLRAQLNGIGYLQGLDSRNSTAVSRGTGGFLQLVSYVAGLSGGGWGVGSLAINDWPTPQSLLDNTYNLSDGLASIGNTTSEDTSYLTQIGNDLTAKQSAGYQVSLIDLWGRLLSTQYVNPITSNNTAGLQWSDIQQTQAFTSAAYPFPIVTAAQDIAGQNAGGGKGTLWEFNPLETGSWDQGIAAFTPTRIFGSTLLNGASTSCITGYDNFGYIIGLSSAIFNAIPVSSLSAGFISVVESVGSAFSSLSSDLINPLASIPNPFLGLASSTLVSSMQNITLVDGGEDGQIIPLVPLLQPARNVDLILALDAGQDTATGWPAGYTMFATYSRYANNSDEFGKIPIPNMPFVNTFVNQGLNTRPTFLGCDSTTDVTNADSSTTLAPIIAYIPNYPWSFLSNLSSLQFGVSNEVSQATLDNAFESATMGGITSGSQIDWPTCLACASLQRSFERSKTDIPEKCQICMNFYCWNGDTNNTAPTAYSPSIGTPQWVVDNAKSPPSNATIIQVSSAASLFSSDYQSWDTHLLVLLFASFCLLL